jgi:hypothetical protein
MRTTVTLDDDVAAAIDKEMRRRPNGSFKQVVNELLRVGIHARRAAQAQPKFVVRARAMGFRRDLNYDHRQAARW